MFDLKPVKTKSGREWMVLADAPGCGAGVVIPEGNFDGMSDEEIGREVRELIREARLLHAQVWAGIINMGSGAQFGDESVVALLSEFRKEDDTVAAAYFKKVEAQRAALVSKGARHDREMRKKIGRGYQQAFRRVLERDGYSCIKCSKLHSEDVLHLVYREQALSDERANPMNLELVCSSCL